MNAIASAASYGDCTPSTSSRLLRAGVVPGEPAFRLEEHRIDGLRLELAVEHQQGRIRCGKLGADLLAIGRGLGVGGPGSRRERRPDRQRRCSGSGRGTDPAGLHRRIDVGRVGRRAGDAREAVGAVVRHHDRAGFLAEFHESRRRAARAAPDRRRRTSRRSAAPPAGRDRAASCRPGRTGRRHRIRERGCPPAPRSAAVTTTDGFERAAQARAGRCRRRRAWRPAPGREWRATSSPASPAGRRHGNRTRRVWRR